MREVYITTVDNPYDPKTQFDEWYAFDEEQGYRTCGLLDRFASGDSIDLSIEDRNNIYETAIDDIIKVLGGLYKKVIYNSSGRAA